MQVDLGLSGVWTNSTHFEIPIESGYDSSCGGTVTPLEQRNELALAPRTGQTISSSRRPFESFVFPTSMANYAADCVLHGDGCSIFDLHHTLREITDTVKSGLKIMESQAGLNLGTDMPGGPGFAFRKAEIATPTSNLPNPDKPGYSTKRLAQFSREEPTGPNGLISPSGLLLKDINLPVTVPATGPGWMSSTVHPIDHAGSVRSANIPYANGVPQQLQHRETQLAYVERQQPMFSLYPGSHPQQFGGPGDLPKGLNVALRSKSSQKMTSRPSTRKSPYNSGQRQPSAPMRPSETHHLQSAVGNPKIPCDTLAGPLQMVAPVGGHSQFMFPDSPLSEATSSSNPMSPATMLGSAMSSILDDTDSTTTDDWATVNNTVAYTLSQPDSVSLSNTEVLRQTQDMSMYGIEAPPSNSSTPGPMTDDMMTIQPVLSPVSEISVNDFRILMEGLSRCPEPDER